MEVYFMQNRFTSWPAWITLLPVIIILGDTYGLWNVIGISADNFTKVFMGIGGILVAFGVFNNPTDKDKF